MNKMENNYMESITDNLSVLSDTKVLDNAENKLNEANNKIIELTNISQELVSINSKYREEIAELEQLDSNNQNAIRILREQLDSNNKIISENNNDIEWLKSQIKELQDENWELTSEINNLSEKIDSVTWNLDKTIKEKEIINGEKNNLLKQLSENKKMSEEEKNKLSAEIENVFNKFLQEKTKREEKDAIIIDLKNQLANYEADSDDLLNETINQEEKLKSLRGKLADENKKLNKFKKDIENEEFKLFSLRKVISKLMKQKKSLESDIESIWNTVEEVVGVQKNAEEKTKESSDKLSGTLNWASDLIEDIRKQFWL